MLLPIVASQLTPTWEHNYLRRAARRRILPVADSDPPSVFPAEFHPSDGTPPSKVPAQYVPT